MLEAALSFLGFGPILAIDPDPARRAFAEKMGADVVLDPTTTGDGIISALQVLHALRASGQTLSQRWGNQEMKELLICS